MNTKVFMTCLLLGALSAHQTEADHEQVAYTFDDGVLFGWSTAILSPGSPFGGQYLGDFAGFDEVFLGILDALPTGDPPNSDPRLVSLRFDLINFSPPTNDLRVTINGQMFDLEADGMLSLLGPHASASLDFPLHPSPQGSADMLIGFQQTAGLGGWGLDNVVVDWSQVVPEPSPTWGLFVGLICFRDRRGREGSQHDFGKFAR